MQADPKRIYLLRACSSDFSDRDDFRWPRKVGAECRAEEESVDGFRGFVNGEGDAGWPDDPEFADWADASRQWLVFSAPAKEVVLFRGFGTGLAEAKSARIEHVGRGATGPDRLQSCLDYLASIGRLGPMAMGVIRKGDDGCRLTGGYGCRLTGGRYSRLVGGDACYLTAGDNSILVGGRRCLLMAGDCSQLTGGVDSHLMGGKDCRLMGGAGSDITGGDRCRLSAGPGSRLKGGGDCSLAGGADSHLTGGHGCRLEAGSGSSVWGRSGCSITGGSGSRLVGDDCCDIMGGDRCTIAGGHRSYLVGGAHCRISSGGYSVLVGGFGSRLMGGRESVLTFRWQDDPKHPHLTILSAVVGEDGIEPGVFYTVKDGAIVEAEDAGVRRRVLDCDVGRAEIWELMQRHR